MTAASARQPGPQADRLVGVAVTEVEAQGKNLLVRFDERARGPDPPRHARVVAPLPARASRWRRPPARARLVLEVPGSVAVCFDAPTVELFEQRAEAVHRALSQARAGPAPRPVRPRGGDPPAARRRRSARRPIGEALLDQRALAGIGNEVRNQVLWEARVSPFRPVEAVDDATLRSLVERARAVLREGARTGRRPSDIHGRSGRPCPRCGSLIRSEAYGGELPRIAYWCPRCQPDPREASR